MIPEDYTAYWNNVRRLNRMWGDLGFYEGAAQGSWRTAKAAQRHGDPSEAADHARLALRFAAEARRLAKLLGTEAFDRLEAP